MGPSLLTGSALLLGSFAFGPWALYVGAAVFGLGVLLLAVQLTGWLLE